ncbi:MAG TPA: RNA polymerase sigma factor [Saprospiraceae bacterium]|nr:RNA polymerase sigma factor [Lewinellaceae bacterium]HPQ22210.1 RNA polymerase sigma factor [Saprospiraceae bacterium]
MQNWEKIIEGCKGNDRKSQEQLYRYFFPPMMTLCMRYCKSEEEAITILNNGFLKVFKKIDTYHFNGSFEGWVRRIVFNCLSDYFRKENLRLKFLILEDYNATIPAESIEKLYEEDLLRLIKKLPSSSAEVFILYAIEGLSHKEIASKKQISEGTSKWHYSEARKKLRELILIQKTNYYHAK